jgi:DNA-binding CsgD family transcriptional regulator
MPSAELSVLSSDLRTELDEVLAGHAVDVRVRPHIVSSWERAAASRLQPERLDVPFEPDVDEDGELARAAHPVLDQLTGDLGDARIAVVLTDAAGLVIERRVTDPSLRAGMDRIELAPGAVYGEDALGTNGIGTALALQHPATVRGGEHFADALTAMACAAAPVVDPRTGRVAGAVDLTSLVSDGSELMMTLATWAAREVGHRLLDNAGVSRRLVLQRFLEERRHAKGPVVVATETTIMANTAADGLIEVDDEAELRAWAGRIMRGGPGATGVPELASGRAVLAAGVPILDGRTPIGAVLRLRTTGEASRSRASFGWDSLTDAERAIADHVARGLTNREVGVRLLLSRHTVGFHLRSIFRKLDVRSRVELARVVTEREADAVTPA